MSLRQFVARARYSPPIARTLYALARPLHIAASGLARQLTRKVRRNGGSAVYDGVELAFPVGVGADFLSSVTWHGIDGFEPHTWRVLRREIEGARTFIDVGANVGFYSVLAHKVRPGIQTLSFEPLPALHADCTAFHRANGVKGDIRQLALSDQDGEATIFEPQHDHDFGQTAASTLVAESWQAQKGGRQSVVRTARLDTLLAGQELPGPVAMKIDVEGFEPAVLRGARETIARYRPRIVCEILPRDHANKETLAVLEELRYVPFAVLAEGCFRVEARDFAKPRLFTDFLLLPQAEAEGLGAYIPHAGA